MNELSFERERCYGNMRQQAKSDSNQLACMALWLSKDWQYFIYLIDVERQ